MTENTFVMAFWSAAIVTGFLGSLLVMAAIGEWIQRMPRRREFKRLRRNIAGRKAMATDQKDK